MAWTEEQKVKAEAEAQAKADELQANDPTGRQYRITQLSAE